MAKADIIYSGGLFLTLDPRRPQAEALAVAGGRILALGTDGEVEALAGPGTRRVRMHGRFAMPGLIESHTHALWGACRDLFLVYVGFSASVDQLADAISQRANAVGRDEWITGGPWRLDMRAELGTTPRDWLDRIAPDHPVAIADMSQHAMWCNSRALALAGLSSASPDIPGGVIERDGTGELTGLLAEAGCAPVRRLSAFTPQQLDEGVDYLLRYLNSLGYTGFKEPMADEATLQAYANAIDAGRWTIHSAAHLTAFSPLSGTTSSPDELDRLRERFTRPDLRLSYAKLFIDGVAPAHTGSFLDPYLPAPDYDPATHDPDATLLMQPDRLNATMTELDRRGYVVKTHAVGDNAVRKVLDAIEAARDANGHSGLRHEIAHTTFVADADLPRFRELDAVAEVSPKLWMPNPGTAAQTAVLGEERMGRVHRIRTLLEAGAEVIFGTDWPAAAPDANPWTGLAGMISRRDPTGQYPGAVAPDEAIPLQTALPLFTVNSARAMGMAGETGQLVEGGYADFIVLAGDIRTMGPEEIGAMKVTQTVWKGTTVHEA